ncbi:thiamine-phosphate kinase [Methyloceanibacter caenitepidi]|uniref:Thiamine-monophosphate kinase n=1 Tax=Methyloceanibacter caenitepidi TaxID=1384459 RepID=A0A0A8K3G2_9HYPH|nr:thiamine-phosphate kinase [Methyloceanibacter caenitepidi]BAQ17425.1 thiamine-monophosphate kinase [Methyloceanibacter caenitepidi]
MALAGEFDIIARIFAPLAKETGALGLKDDAAVLTVTDDHQLVVTCDTLVSGVHFLPDDPPAAIGYKSLAVNLSDLTAKGAHGYAYTLSLALPRDTEMEWLEAFAEGLAEVQELTDISLIGGDTTATSGPLTITITALGLVQHEAAITRLGAKPGDRLYVGGTIGDSCLGLRLLKDPSLAQSWGLSEDDVAYLTECYRRPPVGTVEALLVRNFAKASIDVSDGLAADIEKLCTVSHVGAEIETGRVPFSAAARKALEAAPDLLPDLLTAGDDYVPVIAVSESSADLFESEVEEYGVDFTQLGIVTAGDGIRVLDERGAELTLKNKGFSHF